jgi:prefoldin alpha subunit
MGEEKNLANLVYEQRRIVELIESLYNEINVLERSLLEHQGALEILKMYKESGEKSFDTLLPIGGNIYIPVNVSKPAKIVVGVGGGVFLERPVEDAITYIEEAMKNLRMAVDNRVQTLDQLKNRYEEVSAAITELQFKLQKRE